MNTREIAIATMSWARTAQETQLLREAMCCLARLNLPVVVTDGGSGQSFVEYLRGFRHFTVFQADKPGVLAQTKRSLEGALQLGSRYILYTEQRTSAGAGVTTSWALPTAWATALSSALEAYPVPPISGLTAGRSWCTGCGSSARISRGWCWR
jgi:hypothetical protein